MIEIILGLAAVLGSLLVVLVVGGVAGLMLAGNLLYICEPNEILIFSGRSQKNDQGLLQGYRHIKGGRAFRVPLIEKVDRLDLTNMIIEVTVQGAYSQGGIPLTVQGVANIKIASHDPLLGNAVERLMGKPRQEVIQIAKEVLEGNLRGVLSRLTPEQVNDDKLAFAEQLLVEAEHDLSELGLVLDTMKIQNVHDDRGYLDSIGRRKSAELIKTARVAEAQNKALAIIQDASNRQRARLREIESEEAIARAEAERRVRDAKTKAKALIAEEIGRVNAEIVRVESALEAEEARVEQTRRQMEADVIEPARADMEAGIAEARGRAATILEDGRATVKVLEDMIGVWHEAGDNARDIFLMQKLHSVMGHMVSTIGTVQVDKITMLPPSHGGDSRAVQAVRLVEELKGALGVDLPALLEDYARGRGQPTNG